MSKSCFLLKAIIGIVIVCCFSIGSLAHARSLGLSWTADQFAFEDGRFVCDDTLGGPACEIREDATAGVVPQQSWNNSEPVPYTRAGRIVMGTNNDMANPVEDFLVDDAGVVTGVQVGWTAHGSWSTDGSFDRTESGDFYLHRSGLDQGGDDVDTIITFSNLSSTFADPYDVYVYVGSDVDGRTGRVTLNNDFDTDIYFLSNTRDDEPGGPDQHTRATAMSSGSAFPSNYVLYEDVSGDSFTIVEENILGAGTLVHGIQIDGLPTDPLTGDMDFDEDVDFDDVDDIVLGLKFPEAYEALYGVPPSLHGDTDGDNDFDFDDITGFVDILRGQGGTQLNGVPEPSALVLLVLGLACVGAQWLMKNPRLFA